MQWRFANPAGIAFLAVVVTVFMCVSLLVVAALARSGYEAISLAEIIEGYSGVYSWFFHPSSLRGWRGNPLPSIGAAIILSVWLIGYMLSAQPRKLKLRLTGSIIGVAMTVLWVMYSLLISLISSVR